MRRVLRIELRRSAAVGAGLIVVVAGVVLLYAAPQRWSTGWMELAMTQRDLLLLLWPAALAVGAWQSYREHRSNVGELFASTARPRAQRIVPVLAALGIAMTVAYAAMVLAAAPWFIDTAGYLPAASVVVTAVGALALVAAAWFGLAVGRLVPSPVTAPALAVAGIALLFVAPFALRGQEWLALLFSPVYGMSPFSDFQTVPGRASAAQAIWLAGLAATGVVLLALRSRRAMVLALLPAVLGAALGTVVIPRSAGSTDIAIDPVAQALLCAEGSPDVCVSRVHSGLLPEVTPLARQALALLAKLPDAPTAAHEDTDFLGNGDPATPPRPNTARFQIQVDRSGHLAHPGDVVPRMLEEALGLSVPCTSGHDVVSLRAAAGWLSGREPVADSGEPTERHVRAVQLWQELRQLPESDAAARVASFRDAAVACADTEGLLTASPR